MLLFQEVLQSICLEFLWRPVFIFALFAHKELLFLFVSELWFIGILKSNSEKFSGHFRLFTNAFVQFPQTLCAYKNVYRSQVYRIKIKDPYRPSLHCPPFPSSPAILLRGSTGIVVWYVSFQIFFLFLYVSG